MSEGFSQPDGNSTRNFTPPAGQVPTCPRLFVFHSLCCASLRTPARILASETMQDVGHAGPILDVPTQMHTAILHFDSARPSGESGRMAVQRCRADFVVASSRPRWPSEIPMCSLSTLATVEQQSMGEIGLWIKRKTLEQHALLCSDWIKRAPDLRMIRIESCEYYSINAARSPVLGSH